MLKDILSTALKRWTFIAVTLLVFFDTAIIDSVFHHIHTLFVKNVTHTIRLVHNDVSFHKANILIVSCFHLNLISVNHILQFITSITIPTPLPLSIIMLSIVSIAQFPPCFSVNC
jgi:hypothetical protein